MIKLIIVTLLLFLFTGCSATKPPMTEYKINYKPLQIDITSNRCSDKSLKVSQSFSPSSLKSLNMNYMLNEQKIYTYSQAQWNNSPNQEISMQIVKLLRDSKLFKNTQSSKSRSRSDLILETNIDEFMQYYSEDLKQSYSSVAISVTLIDVKTNMVIASKTFYSSVNSESLDASGGVKALDVALRDVLKQTIEFLGEVCK